MTRRQVLAALLVLAVSCGETPPLSPSTTLPITGSSVIERNMTGSVFFADPVGRTLDLYSGAFWHISMLWWTEFTGDAKTFDEILELQRAGYQLSAAVTFFGTDQNGQVAEALRVSITKKSLGPRTAGARMRVTVSSFYGAYGIPSYIPTNAKWISYVPPYATIRADSELRSVEAIMAALAASDRVCLYEDGTITSTYATLTRVIGAWQMTDSSTKSADACTKK